MLLAPHLVTSHCRARFNHQLNYMQQPKIHTSILVMQLEADLLGTSMKMYKGGASDGHAGPVINKIFPIKVLNSTLLVKTTLLVALLNMFRT